jgi:hypothetical protein
MGYQIVAVLLATAQTGYDEFNIFIYRLPVPVSVRTIDIIEGTLASS